MRRYMDAKCRQVVLEACKAAADNGATPGVTVPLEWIEQLVATADAAEAHAVERAVVTSSIDPLDFCAICGEGYCDTVIEGESMPAHEACISDPHEAA